MDEAHLILSRPPIVEAVIDIDCDLPPGLSLKAIEPAVREAFGGQYPKFQAQIVQEHQIEQQGDSVPKVSARRGIQSLQCLTADNEQLVQVRAQGFSFNRLAPYSTLDNYLPEIERTWRLFRDLVEPRSFQRDTFEKLRLKSSHMNLRHDMPTSLVGPAQAAIRRWRRPRERSALLSLLGKPK